MRPFPFWKKDVRTDALGRAALKRALAGDDKAWRDFLTQHPHRDGVALVNSSSDESLKRRTRLNGRESANWILSVGSTAPGSKYRELNTIELILYQTCSVLVLQLTDSLARRHRDLPPSGFVYCITEYLQWAVVVRYRFSGAAASLEFLQVIERPEAIFDVSELLVNASDDVKAVVKNAMKSRAKLVWHRGVLVHVDRYDEPGVFGPTIDTVGLHDVLVQLAHEHGPQDDKGPTTRVTNALEVGCGNGLLSTGILLHFQPTRLIAVDIDTSAVQCSLRNIRGVMEREATQIHGVIGPFDRQLFRGRFDLVVANPPYIPRKSKRRQDSGDFLTAVAGTELLEELVRSAESLIEKDGAMILVYSNLASSVIERAIPPSLELIPLHTGRGVPVLFDLEDVFSDKEWLAELTDSLEWAKGSSQIARHRLHIVALVHKLQPDAEQVDSVAIRARRMAALNAGQLETGRTSARE